MMILRLMLNLHEKAADGILQIGNDTEASSIRSELVFNSNHGALESGRVKAPGSTGTYSTFSTSILTTNTFTTGERSCHGTEMHTLNAESSIASSHDARGAGVVYITS